MSSSDYNLIRVVRSLNFENEVVGVRVGNELIFEGEVDNNGLASILHTLEHLCVLYGDSCTGDLGQLRVIFHIAGMD